MLHFGYSMKMSCGTIQYFCTTKHLFQLFINSLWQMWKLIPLPKWFVSVISGISIWKVLKQSFSWVLNKFTITNPFLCYFSTGYFLLSSVPVKKYGFQIDMDNISREGLKSSSKIVTNIPNLKLFQHNLWYEYVGMSYYLQDASISNMWQVTMNDMGMYIPLSTIWMNSDCNETCEIYSSCQVNTSWNQNHILMLTCLRDCLE